jgi:hypothetical protein
MKTLAMTVGKAIIHRSESYNHNTNAKVEWTVTVKWASGEERIVRTCKTRKEALQWAEIYKA